MAGFGDQFLSSMMGGGGDIVSSAFNTLVAGATGGFKGRPQWKDLQFMNDAQNRLWPDEIKRQGAFLEGLAPSQAAAYNTYQGATYHGDTDRQVDRIKDMSSSLGMSPWEITGAGGANPLPSPGPPQGQQGRSSMPDFLQALVPMQIAKQQSKTALMQTKMNNDTSLKIAGQQTAEGQLPQSQVALNAANKALSDQNLAESLARVSQINAQTDQTQVQTTLNMVTTLAMLAPKVSVGAGPYSITGIGDSSPLLQLGKALMNSGPGERDEKVRAYLQSAPTNMMNQLARDMKTVSKYIKENAYQGGKDMFETAQQGLKGFLSGVWDAADPKNAPR